MLFCLHMVAHPSLFLLIFLFLLWADWQYVKAANLILLNYFFPNISCVPYHVYNRNYITYLKYEEFIYVSLKIKLCLELKTSNYCMKMITLTLNCSHFFLNLGAAQDHGDENQILTGAGSTQSSCCRPPLCLAGNWTSGAESYTWITNICY